LVFVAIGKLQLVARDREAALHGVFAFGAAGTEPPLQFFHGPGADEDRHRLGKLPEDFSGPVDVDL
jgi:hypothetical protein